ncbi:MAG: inosine/xanthosine triphosphatase [Anaerolineae bacterium]
MKVVVASQNPVKLEATRAGFDAMFPQMHVEVIGVTVTSDVRAQPMSRAETLEGASNRVQNATLMRPDAQYIVGIEGGVEHIDSQLAVFAWVVIQHGDQIGRAQTGVFYLPREVAELVLAGHELGDADDIIFGQENSKQKNGSLGLLTDDALTRTNYYIQAIIMALIPFKKPDFTWR